MLLFLYFWTCVCHATPCRSSQFSTLKGSAEAQTDLVLRN